MGKEVIDLNAKNEAEIKAIREGLEGIVQRLKNIEKTYTEMPPEAKADFASELDPSELDKLPWRRYNKGPGSWIFGDIEGAEKLSELIKESQTGRVPIGNYNYKMSQGRDKTFISRTPIGKNETKKDPGQATL